MYGGGLRVYTTLDMARQGEAADAVTSTLDRPGDPAAAMVSIDDQGAVVAMIGGLDYDGSSPYSKVNLATGTEGGGGGRQAGSSFKPIVLAEALSQGISLNQTFNAPVEGAPGAPRRRGVGARRTTPTPGSARSTWSRPPRSRRTPPTPS